jgi:hypothetical protein
MTGGHPQIHQENFKTKILALISNLTWLHNIYKYHILMPLQPESDLDLNRMDIEKFVIFPTVICTSRYDKWFRSYEILKSAKLLKFLCWADLSILRNLSFWPQIQYNLRKLSIENSYLTSYSFWWLFTHPHTINGLGVMIFWTTTKLLKFLGWADLSVLRNLRLWPQSNCHLGEPSIPTS